MRTRVGFVFAALTVIAAIGGLVAGSAGAQPVRFTTSLAGGGQDQDPDGSGAATVALDAAAGTVCFDLTWTKIRGPFAAHIHAGAQGAAGDIVVHFFDMKGGTPLAGTIRGVSGCAKNIDASLIDAIAADPSGYYVNVHNVRFPAGAIRGQLATSSSPSPSGSPSGGGTGSPPPSPYPQPAS